ncbi:MAG: FHA domain-containing protein [bacterium]|nr:FHA domain-containing protein [bacterium]
MKLTIEIRPNDKVSVDREYAQTALVIGRDQSCDLTIAIDIVSSRHARLEYAADQWRLTDLDSSNGTYVNGQRIHRQTAVAVDDEIQLGVDGPRLRIKQFTETPIAAEVVPSVPQPPTQSASKDVEQPFHAGETAIPSPPRDVVIEAPKRKKRATVVAQSAQEGKAMPRSVVVFHVFSLLTTAAYCTFLFAAYLLFTVVFRAPPRGYTFIGLTVGTIATLFFLAVAVYSWRKRIGQEMLPGRLQNWLRLHVWLSLGAVWLVLLHAGFHLDGGTGTWTFLFLIIAVFTGLIGLWFYRRIPVAVAGKVGNLAIADATRQLQLITSEIEDAVAGRSEALRDFAVQTLNGQAVATTVPHDESAIADQIAELGSERHELQIKLASQQRLRFVLRSWLWLHIPLSIAFLMLLPVHVFDALELRYVVIPAGPADFDSPESCRKCHESQYNEWIGSMHAIAQASPVTDLQNRLVLLKEERDLASGALSEPIVGNLCVRCHAPTGSLGTFLQQEDNLAEREERAPASHFGVSCVSCHQISEIHPSPDSIDRIIAGEESFPFDNDEDRAENIIYKNADNLIYTQGRLMVGPLGGNGDLPSVGNEYHRGEFRDHFDRPEFCASCHTVVANHPQTGKRIVKLQNTYNEWREGGKPGSIICLYEKVQCLDCHGRDLKPVVAVAEAMSSARTPLSTRLERIVSEMKQNQNVVPQPPFAATPADAFDSILKPRRKFLHTFVGVDYHLEKDLPYAKDHPLAGDNSKIQAEAVRNTQDLLKIAAAIRMKVNRPSSVSRRNLQVDVLNLGTGHHLPAGFAFAREMWVEVSVSQTTSGEDFEVLVGGNAGKPLPKTVPLDVTDPGLRNFQAILYNRESKAETVLQNEADFVHFGSDQDGGYSNEAGADGIPGLFPTRRKFMLPGEIRTLNVTLPLRFSTIQRNIKRMRVRLLFRNYPPQFLEALAVRFDQLGDDERAARCRNLVNGLRIHEMARDEISSF